MKPRQQRPEVRFADSHTGAASLHHHPRNPMRSPYTQLYLHLVWSTWRRYPYLGDAVLRQRVYECINATCTRLRSDVLAIGGIEDHVHVLVRPAATISPAELVKRMKGASSHMVNYDIGGPDYFKWQGGYGAFSVSKRHVPMIRDYVLRQEEHHREQHLFELLEPPPPDATMRPADTG